MKTHPYCSAAIGGEAACKKLWQQGIRLDDLQKLFFIFRLAQIKPFAMRRL